MSRYASSKGGAAAVTGGEWICERANMVGANNFIMAPYCWIARFTPGNVLPVARELTIYHIYGIKIPVATPLRYVYLLYLQ